MGPVFEYAFVDGLRLPQIGAAVVRDAGEQDVMVTALDDVDGVDLDIAEMRDRIGGRLRSVAEGRGVVEPLRVQPDAAGGGWL